MKPLRVKRDAPIVTVLVCPAIQAVASTGIVRPDGFGLLQNSVQEGSLDFVRDECSRLRSGLE